MLSPRTRTSQQGLLIETIGDETLLYDEHCHRAFCLNRIASAVWQHCDGASSTKAISASITEQLGFAVSEEAVILAVQDFQKDKLLQPSEKLLRRPVLSRRELTLKLGCGAAMLLPSVASIAAPPAAQVYSGCADCVTFSSPGEGEQISDSNEVLAPVVDREPDTYGYPEMNPAPQKQPGVTLPPTGY